MPVSRIETLSQGVFLGKVADNNTTKIERKLFCGEIQIDMDRYRRKQEEKLPLPMMTDFGDADIENNVRRLGEQVIRQDIKRRLMDREHAMGRFPSSEDLKEEIDQEFKALSRDEAEEIIRKASSDKCQENVNSMVRENFEKIKQEVWNIIVTENEKLPFPHDLSRIKGVGEEE